VQQRDDEEHSGNTRERLARPVANHPPAVRLLSARRKERTHADEERTACEQEQDVRDLKPPLLLQTKLSFLLLLNIFLIIAKSIIIFKHIFP